MARVFILLGLCWLYIWIQHETGSTPPLRAMSFDSSSKVQLNRLVENAIAKEMSYATQPGKKNKMYVCEFYLDRLIKIRTNLIVNG